jgi:hypothetical protein
MNTKRGGGSRLGPASIIPSIYKKNERKAHEIKSRFCNK